MRIPLLAASLGPEQEGIALTKGEAMDTPDARTTALQATAELFRAYASRFDAASATNGSGWAAITAGQAERLIDCLEPLIAYHVRETKVGAADFDYDEAVLRITNRLARNINAPLGPFPTFPWMPGQVLECQAELRAKILRELQGGAMQNPDPTAKVDSWSLPPEIENKVRGGLLVA